LFGYRIHPITKTHRFHDGIDIANIKSTDIVATADGVVKFSGIRGGYGKSVVIDHGNGFETSYSHANEILVSTGMKVTRGTVIARMGSTGLSTGNHLHYEVKNLEYFTVESQYHFVS
jgi:murein DD-endopeptidase MepM/ murein hydrolase activator NlpD